MFVPLEFPPGLSRVGTEYQSRGRFWDANLWRWSRGKSGPIGGWLPLASGFGTARGLHSWTDINGNGRAAVMSRDAMRLVSPSGSVTPITPAGFGTKPDAAQWSVDNAGQRLFAVNDADGIIRTWLPGDIAATTLTNAPAAASLLVTSESILVALGAGGNPRLIQWCNVDAYTVWTPTPQNYAGDYILQSAGEIMCGRRIRNGNLILTSQDAHVMRYLDKPIVYGFQRIGADCGAISRNAVQSVDDQAFWMGRDGFFTTGGGGVTPIPCEVHDDVFGSPEEPQRGINRAHTAKVTSMHLPEHDEIWWMFPHGSNTENSRIVVYNYMERHWTLHLLTRLAGIGPGNGFVSPLMLSADGTLWRHETGQTRNGAGSIYARSGPLELGSGDRTMYADLIVPDEIAPGDVQTFVHARLWPNASERTFGPFTSANPTGARFAARQAAIEHRLVNGNGTGRVGTFRVRVVAGGAR